MTECTPYHCFSMDSTEPFSFVHYNVNSLLAGIDTKVPLQHQFSKMDEMYSLFVVEKKYQVIALTESKLGPDISDEYIDVIDDYTCKPYRSDVSRHQAGILIYVHKQLVHNRRHDLESLHPYMMWIQFNINKKNVLFCTCYRPPGQNQQEILHFLDSLYNSVDKAQNENPDCIIITGDLNDRCVLWDDEHNVSELKNRLRDMILQLGMYQLIREPTHFTNHSAYLLDLIITDAPGFIRNTGVLPLMGNLGHTPIYGILNLNSKCQNSIKKTVWHYNNADTEGLNEHLLSINWEDLLGSRHDINEKVKYFTKCFVEASKSYIPVRSITIRSKDKPYITGHVKRLISIRNRWCGVYNRTKKPVHRMIRNIFRSRVKNEMSRLKAEYYEKQKSQLNDPKLSVKKYWSIVKSIYGNKVKGNIPTLIDNNVQYSTPLEKATLLNEYFAEQSTLPPEPPTFSLPPFHYITNARLDHIEFDAQNINYILRKLPVGKACGSDGISNRLLCMCSSSISVALCNIFQYSMDIGVFPESWKGANVSSVYKKLEDFVKSNYRPISLLSCISKVMERVVFNVIYDYCVVNGLFNDRNSGFKHGDSTVYQLTNIVHRIYKNMDDEFETCMVFLDISKAFDKVYHRGLLFKLRQIGICGSLLDWIESYISNRKQRVVVDGIHSPWKNTNAGVPQGSILGPLLFLIYINDISDNISSEVFIFADDTSLMRKITNVDSDFDILNQDLLALSEWADQWRVTFNASKTEYMIFSLKHTVSNYPILKLNNEPIIRVQSHKHLGLTLDTKLTWTEHVTEITNKASKRIGNIKRIRSLIPRRTAEHLYMHLARPILEYGDIVFDNLSLELQDKIEHCQRDAMVVCSCANKRTHTENLQVELGWEALADRRRHHRLILFYKLHHGTVPAHLTFLTPEPSVVTSYRLRSQTSKSQIRVPFARIKKLQNAFIVKTSNDWNDLDDSIKSCETLASFKYALKQLTPFKPNRLYSSLDSRANTHHTRMRLGLSSLKQQLYSYNIIDDQLCEKCSCECPETTTHFFLHCTKYSVERQSLYNSISHLLPDDLLVNLLDDENILVHVLLNGSNNVNVNVNTRLFEIVHNYIRCTNRFT